jgi:hypothetical protein
MKMWLASESWKREQAARFRDKYRGGVGLLSPTMYLFATVDPRGNIRELAPPFHRYEMWQTANQPEIERCPCGDYYDPEVGGPWRDRPEYERGVHHPFCQFDPHAKKVFHKAAELAVTRLEQGARDAQERPDEWNKIREAVASK